MEEDRARARPLGELVLDRGFVTREQLEDALLEQRTSHQRLGAILVAHGAVSPHDLTAALQAQVWEATGGNADILPGPRAADEVADRPRRAFLRRRWPRYDDAKRGQVARDDSEATEQDRTKMLRDLHTITEMQVQSLRREIDEKSVELDAARAEAAARSARITQLEAQVQAAERERLRLTAALHVEIRELENDLRSIRLSARSQFATPPPAATERSVTDVVTPEESYLMLVRNGTEEHVLQEFRGAPPPIGAEVEVGGKRVRVVSHRRSPLGLDERVCVHVNPA